jgi:RNA polymerase sigma-70 factor (ECF subfamily)
MKYYQTYSDDELIKITAMDKEPGKSAAFSELYKRYSTSIYLYCRKVFGDGNFAEDVFQDTFLQFLKSIENGIVVGNVQGYLLRTARNLSLNIKRNNKTVLVEFEDFHANFNDNSLDNKELSHLIDSAIELLSDDYKEAFILQAYQGLSYSEIAIITKVPLTTVRNRIVRAKSKLREILTPLLEEKNEDKNYE